MLLITLNMRDISVEKALVEVFDNAVELLQVLVKVDHDMSGRV